MEPVKLTLSLRDLRRAGTCDLDERVADLTAHLGRDVTEDETIDLRIWLALPTTTDDDAIWSLRAARPRLDAARVSVFVAKAAADRVAHLQSGQRQAAADAAYRAAAYAAHDAYTAAADAAAYAAAAAAKAAAHAAAGGVGLTKANDAYAAALAAYDAAKAASQAELLSVLA